MPSAKTQAQSSAIDHPQYDIADGPGHQKTGMEYQPDKMARDRWHQTNRVVTHYGRLYLGHCVIRTGF